ncbi:MAG: hypothetical protein IJK53_09570 [Erysipelotrichaceae bacterium]|nr:hypothetical protein [Erysipelotrichaceae bacterium]
MGLFDVFKKKPEPELLRDEKKEALIEAYQTKKDPLIKDLQVKPLGKADTYIEGKAYCKFWNTMVDVDMYDDTSVEYAEKCVEAMNSMPEELVENICQAAKKYCLEFLDAIGGAEENDIELAIPVDEDTPALEMLKCFDIGTLAVETPKDPSRIGYQLSGNCDWEQEHGIEIVILDDKLLYLGEFVGESPWRDRQTDS